MTVALLSGHTNARAAANIGEQSLFEIFCCKRSVME
jgi:hypothetical protein